MDMTGCTSGRILLEETPIRQRYLNLPVQRDSTARSLEVRVDGVFFDAFTIALARDQADFWVFLDLDAYRGRTLTVVDMTDGEALDSVSLILADAIVGADQIYAEPLRPRFHFSARRGWLNDPNGLYYFAGEYHLFFQHNPYGVTWGNMHWGHAVSDDLIHWQELPEALYPDDFGTMFSGCAIVDWRNTAGFQSGPEPAQVLMYTAAGDTSEASRGKPYVQCLAYSNDRGRTWTKYAGNPVLGHLAGTNRDPKVIWHAPSARWVMALYLDGATYGLFVSPDLKAWAQTDAFDLPGCWECPDFFPLPVDGDPDNGRWVFWAANGAYRLGDFDGARFTARSPLLHSHYGNNSYAAQTWSDLPESDSRRLQISWATMDLPGMPFNKSMTFPVNLSLRTSPDGVRLYSEPVAEIARLAERSRSWRGIPVAERPAALDIQVGDCFDLRAQFTLSDEAMLGITIRGVALTYDAAKRELRCLDRTAPLALADGKLRLRLLGDRASLEIFAQDGLVAMPMGVVFPADDPRLVLFAHNGATHVDELTVTALLRRPTRRGP